MKKILTILTAALTLASCGSFDEINQNPDASTNVTPSFLATNAILNVTARTGRKWFVSDAWIVKQLTHTEFMEDYLYNKFEKSNFDDYELLTSTLKMVEIAEADEMMPEEKKNSYRALNLFVQSYVFYNKTMEMGDIPCSEALKGESESLIEPKYDTQEQVFETIINNLSKASDLFAHAVNFEGDPILSGKSDLWEKTTNAFLLRVLNMVSKKAKVGTIDVKSKFEQVAALPLYANEDESLQRVYSADKSSQWYPFYWEINNDYAYPYFSSFFVDMMKSLNDKRLFLYAEPAPVLKDKGEDTFDAYSGVDVVKSYGTVQSECMSGMHSPINKRYHRNPQGEPTKVISYSEIQFILAEAALRGWKTPMSAKQHYENGVSAAMLFAQANTPEQYCHNVVIDESTISEYLDGAAKFDESKGLEQVITQKFIASFLQYPYNSYFDYRRTGLPKLPISEATNLNEKKDRMPVRWMYPTSEYSLNKTNIQEAVQRQFGGTDTPNGVMWILK